MRTELIHVLVCMMLALHVPTARAQPFDDDHRCDAWGVAGLGVTKSSHGDVVAFGVNTGITGRVGAATVSARYSTQSNVFLESAGAVSFLVGPFVRIGGFRVVPSAGAGWAWGRYDVGLFGRGTEWGPHAAFAYEVDVIPEAVPFAGITVFGNVNRSNSYIGLAVAARFGSFFGAT